MRLSVWTKGKRFMVCQVGHDGFEKVGEIEAMCGVDAAYVLEKQLESMEAENVIENLKAGNVLRDGSYHSIWG